MLLLCFLFISSVCLYWGLVAVVHHLCISFGPTLAKGSLSDMQPPVIIFFNLNQLPLVHFLEQKKMKWTTD